MSWMGRLRPIHPLLLQREREREGSGFHIRAGTSNPKRRRSGLPSHGSRAPAPAQTKHRRGHVGQGREEVGRCGGALGVQEGFGRGLGGAVWPGLRLAWRRRPSRPGTSPNPPPEGLARTRRTYGE